VIEPLAPLRMRPDFWRRMTGNTARIT